MSKLTKEERIVRAIIDEHGPVLDLRADPHLFIELVRKYAFDLADDDGGLPGGVGPVNPPGPTSRQSGPSLDDVMKGILKIQRQLSGLTRSS